MAADGTAPPPRGFWAASWRRQLALLVGLAAATAYFAQFFACCDLARSDTARWHRRVEFACASFGNGSAGNYIRELLDFPALLERLPAWGIAGAIAFVALLLGDALLAMVRRRLPPLERLAWAFALGIGGLSLLTLWLGWAGWLNRASLAFAGLAILAAWIAALRRRPPPPPDSTERKPWPAGLVGLAFAAAGLGSWFALAALLAASVPTPDLDAAARHLAAPKWWFAEGRISPRPDYAFAALPDFVGMLNLLGMTLAGDWKLGGLAGQVCVWAFGPFGALAAGLLAAERFGAAAGWLAGLAYVSTPWVHRLSSTPHAEGPLLFFVALAALAASRGRGHFSLAGAAAGFAASCAPWGFFAAAVPAAAVIAWTTRGRGLLAFAAGAALAFAPWAARNAAWTGDPFHPLAHRLFGGTAATARLAAELRPTEPSWRSLEALTLRPFRAADATHGGVLGDVPANPLQSPRLFAFAPLAFAVRRRGAAWLASIAAAEVALHFLLSNGSERGWLPAEPFLAALAGGGLAALRGLGPLLWGALLAVAALAANLLWAISSDGCGRPSVTRPLKEEYSRLSYDGYLRTRGPVVGKSVLFLDEPNPYSEHSADDRTIFDECAFEATFKARPGEAAFPSGVLSDPAAIRQRCAALGIEELWVNWEWVERRRKLGGAVFLTREAVGDLMETEALDSARFMGAGYGMYRVMPPRAPPTP